MTNLPNFVGGTAAVMMILLAAVSVIPLIWCRLSVCGRTLPFAFAVMSCVLTISAQKGKMRVWIDRHDAKGFDCSWDYGDLKPADIHDGETIKLFADVGLDYELSLGILPVTVTNYHVNAVQHGFPSGWMSRNVKVKAECARHGLFGEANVCRPAQEPPRHLDELEDAR